MSIIQQRLLACLDKTYNDMQSSNVSFQALALQHMLKTQSEDSAISQVALAFTKIERIEYEEALKKASSMLSADKVPTKEGKLDTLILQWRFDERGLWRTAKNAQVFTLAKSIITTGLRKDAAIALRSITREEGQSSIFRYNFGNGGQLGVAAMNVLP